MSEMSAIPRVKTHMIPLSDYRTHIAQLTARVSHIPERILLTKHGRPFAAVVSMRDLEMIERFDNKPAETLRQEFDDIARRFASAQNAGRSSWEAEAHRQPARYPGPGDGGYHGGFDDG